MVYARKTYHCSKCRKPFGSFREAEDCELGHIVQKSVDGFSSDLRRILAAQDRISSNDG